MNTKKISNCFILFILISGFFILSGICSFQNAHAATVDYTMTVGQTRTIYANVSGYNVVSGTGYWSSNDPSSVSIVSQSAYSHSCTIRANASTGGTYAYLEYRFQYKTSAGYYVTGMRGYKVAVTEPEPYYSVNISPSSFTLDLAGTNYQYASISFTVENSPYSDLGWDVTTDSDVVCCDLYTTEDGRLLFRGVNPGKENLTFYLLAYSGSSYVVLAKKTVYVTVKCSHSYGEGECIKEATKDAEGTMQYICSICDNIKTTTIPAKGYGVVKGKSMNAVCDMGQLKLNVELETNTEGCTTYTALYNTDDTLSDVFEHNLAANELKFSLNKNITDGEYNVKVFFWDNENHMIPLGECMVSNPISDMSVSAASTDITEENLVLSAKKINPIFENGDICFENINRLN